MKKKYELKVRTLNHFLKLPKYECEQAGKRPVNTTHDWSSLVRVHEKRAESGTGQVRAMAKVTDSSKPTNQNQYSIFFHRSIWSVQNNFKNDRWCCPSVPGCFFVSS